MRNSIWTRTAGLLLLAGTLLGAPPLDTPGARTAYVSVQCANAADGYDVRERDVSILVNDIWDTDGSFAQPVSQTIEARVTNAALAHDERILIPVDAPTVPGLRILPPVTITLPDLLPEPGGALPTDVTTFLVEMTATTVFDSGPGTGTTVATATHELHYVPATSAGDPLFDLEALIAPDEPLRLQRGTRGTLVFASISNDLSTPVLINATVSARVVSSEPGGDDPDGVTIGLTPTDVEIDASWLGTLPSNADPLDVAPLGGPVRTRLLRPEGVDAGVVQFEMPADIPAGTAVEVTVDEKYDYIDGVQLRRSGRLIARATAVATDEPPEDDTLRATHRLENGLLTTTQSSSGEVGFASGSTATTFPDPDPGIQPFFPGAKVELRGLGVLGAGPGTDEREQTIEVPEPPLTFTYQATSVRGRGVGTATNNFVTLENLPPGGGTFKMVEVFAGATTPATVEVVRDFATDEILIYGPPQANRRGPLLYRLPYIEFLLFGTPGGVEFRPAGDTCHELIFTKPSDFEIRMRRAAVIGPDPSFDSALQVLFSLVDETDLDFDLTVTSTGNVTATLDPDVEPDGTRAIDVILNAPAATTPGVTVTRVLVQATAGAKTATGSQTMLHRQGVGAPPRVASIQKLTTLLKRTGQSKDRASLGIAITPRAIAAGAGKRSAPLPESCRDVVVDFGGDITRLTLDDRGRAKSDDKRRAIKAKVRTAKDGSQTVTLKVVLKKLDLAGSLGDDGAVDATTGKPGLELTIPVNVVWCGEYFAGAATVRYVAKEGKKGKLKLVR